MTSEGPGDVADATVREFSSGQKLFGRYTLIKILGRGGMGIVWLARGEELERKACFFLLRKASEKRLVRQGTLR